MQTYDQKPRQRVWEVMKSQGMQENQQVVFMSDGGEDVRQVQEYLHPNSEHLIDWFHITMRLTVLQQQTKALQADRPDEGAASSRQIESVKHLLWHGNVDDALDRIDSLFRSSGQNRTPHARVKWTLSVELLYPGNCRVYRKDMVSIHGGTRVRHVLVNSACRVSKGHGWSNVHSTHRGVPHARVGLSVFVGRSRTRTRSSCLPARTRGLETLKERGRDIQEPARPALRAITLPPLPSFLFLPSSPDTSAGTSRAVRC